MSTIKNSLLWSKAIGISNIEGFCNKLYTRNGLVDCDYRFSVAYSFPINRLVNRLVSDPSALRPVLMLTVTEEAGAINSSAHVDGKWRGKGTLTWFYGLLNFSMWEIVERLFVLCFISYTIIYISFCHEEGFMKRRGTLFDGAIPPVISTARNLYILCVSGVDYMIPYSICGSHVKI
jgi:hypothetical protein